MLAGVALRLFWSGVVEGGYLRPYSQMLDYPAKTSQEQLPSLLYLSEAPLQGRLLAISANTSCKGLPGTKTL